MCFNQIIDDKESQELRTLTAVFNDLSCIESVMRASLELRSDELQSSVPIDRDSMKRALSAEAGRPISDAEVDLIFSVSHDLYRSTCMCLCICTYW